MGSVSRTRVRVVTEFRTPREWTEHLRKLLEERPDGRWPRGFDSTAEIVFAIAMQSGTGMAPDRVRALLEARPEARRWTHERVGEVLGLTRETVTRTGLIPKRDSACATRRLRSVARLRYSLATGMRIQEATRSDLEESIRQRVGELRFEKRVLSAMRRARAGPEKRVAQILSDQELFELYEK